MHFFVDILFIIIKAKTTLVIFVFAVKFQQISHILVPLSKFQTLNFEQISYTVSVGIFVIIWTISHIAIFNFEQILHVLLIFLLVLSKFLTLL